MPYKKKNFTEHRKYLRLDTVFPVQFRLEALDQKSFLSGWLQGFTNNISRGGLCLSINNLDPQAFKLIKEKKSKLSLEIDIPISKNPIPAQTSIVWVREIPTDKCRYLVGLNYEHISAKQNRKLMRYAWMKKLFIPVVLLGAAILVLALGINSYINSQLTRSNQLLVEGLAVVLKDSNLIKQKIGKVSLQRRDFQTKLKWVCCECRIYWQFLGFDPRQP